MPSVPADPQSPDAVREWAEDSLQALEVLQRRVLGGGKPPGRWDFLTPTEVVQRIAEDRDELELCAAFGLLASAEAHLRAGQERLDLAGKSRPPGCAAAPAGKLNFVELCGNWHRIAGKRGGHSEFSEIRGWIGFRDWFAHGRHWTASLPASSVNLFSVFNICRQAFTTVSKKAP
jgi:hypothetical protein